MLLRSNRDRREIYSRAASLPGRFALAMPIDQLCGMWTKQNREAHELFHDVDNAIVIV